MKKRHVLRERPQAWRLSEPGMINVMHLSLATALSACTLDHHLSSRIVLKVVSKGHRDRVIAVVALVRSRNSSNDTSQSCSRRNRPIYATSTRLRMEPPGNCAGKFSCLDEEQSFGPPTLLIVTHAALELTVGLVEHQEFSFPS